MTAERVLARGRWTAVIDGERLPPGRPPGDGGTFEVVNPATGEVIAEVGADGPELVDAAVSAARAAFAHGWRDLRAAERARLLALAAERIGEHGDELIALEALEVGKPVRECRTFDLAACVASFAYFGRMADALPGEYLEQGPVNAQIRYEPYGVVGIVIPFNWPPVHLGGKVAAALAAGNTVVVKPGEQAPLTALRIVELLQDVLPPGVVNAVCGLAAGAALAAHPGVGKLSFTGSSATGIAVQRAAAANLTPAVMELGGKNACIVFADADLDAALRGAFEGMFFNNAEACTCTSRVLVHDDVLDAFIDRFAPAVAGLRVGDPSEEATELGPMVDARQKARVLEHLDAAVAEGARIVAQGATPEDPRLAGGYWVAPTLLAEVTPGMRIAQEETFGPICAVLRFSGYDEAIAIANGVDYGLTAAVYTRDALTAERAVRDLDVGMAFVNNYHRGSLIGSPFGGVKHSGYGRDLSVHALREFTRLKNVRMPSGREPVPTWPPARRALPVPGE